MSLAAPCEVRCQTEEKMPPRSKKRDRDEEPQQASPAAAVHQAKREIAGLLARAPEQHAELLTALRTIRRLQSQDELNDEAISAFVAKPYPGGKLLAPILLDSLSDVPSFPDDVVLAALLVVANAACGTAKATRLLAVGFPFPQLAQRAAK